MSGWRLPQLDAEFAAFGGKGSAAAAAARAAKDAQRIEGPLSMMERICIEGHRSLRAIAADLNTRVVETPRGGE